MNDDMLAKVLTEFHERNMRTRTQETGIPKPFEIQTSVQSLGGEPRLVKGPQKDPTFLDEQRRFKHETEFYFGQNYVGHPPGQHYFTLGMLIGGYNEGALEADVAITVLYGRWETSQGVTPYQVGDLGFNWNAGHWEVPGPGKPMATPVATVTYIGLAVAPGYTIGVTQRMQFGLRSAKPPFKDAEHIYITGQAQDLWHAHNESAVSYIEGAWSWFT